MGYLLPDSIRFGDRIQSPASLDSSLPIALAISCLPLLFALFSFHSL